MTVGGNVAPLAVGRQLADVRIHLGGRLLAHLVERRVVTLAEIRLAALLDEAVEGILTQGVERSGIGRVAAPAGAAALAAAHQHRAAVPRQFGAAAERR